ncbi:MAG: hypothetical protein QM723_25635 [Myxococcaceae bacterium]
MSYDLYFHRAGGAPSVASLRKYFSKRKNWSLGEKRAHYENERTGVYFGFDFTSAAEDGRAPLAFNINYFRPHVFGLEAEPELTHFVDYFELEVDDPQGEGMGRGRYTPEGFLTGWNHGNRFAYRACLTMPEAKEQQVFALPALKHQGLWRFNRAYDSVGEHLMDKLDELPPCFVPTAMLLALPTGKVATGIVWTLDMPIVLPNVDLVLSKREDGLHAAPMMELLGLLPVHDTWEADFVPADGSELGMRSFVVDQPNEDLTARLWASMRPMTLSRLSTDQVLDAELLPVPQQPALHH